MLLVVISGINQFALQSISSKDSVSSYLEVSLGSIILEFMDHSIYNKIFGYRIIELNKTKINTELIIFTSPQNV